MYSRLFQNSLEGLEYLRVNGLACWPAILQTQLIKGSMAAYLYLNLGLRNVLLAATAIGNLLRLSQLRLDGLCAEVLQRVALDRVDAHVGVGLHNSKATRHYSAGLAFLLLVQPASAPVFFLELKHKHGNRFSDVIVSRTEELLAAAALLDNFDQTRLQLLDRRNVVGQDAHLTGLGRDVDLDHILRLVDRLWSTQSQRSELMVVYRIFGTPR